MGKVIVSVIIPTYNHKLYIKKAIESALDQECDFPYEIIVGDDYSTDGTGEICKQYERDPRVSVLSYRHNLGLIANYRSLFSASIGKYIAILEGDDYWEKNKLAEQITFLENHPDVGLVHSNGYLLFENGKSHMVHKKSKIPGELTYWDLINSNKIVAVTACFKRDLLQYVDLNRFESLGFKTIDYPLWLEFIQHTRMAFINKSLATYRITADSISNHKSIEKRTAFEESNRSILEYYCKKYPVSQFDQRFILEKFHKKMYYLILYCGTFKDQDMLSMEYLHLPPFKRFALRSKILFLLYQRMVKLFYNRV